jgi:hypothetical protein
METPNLQPTPPVTNPGVQPPAPAVQTPIRRYRWWRIAIWFGVAFLIMYFGNFLPLQKGNDSGGDMTYQDCSCTTFYTGFPLPWAHVGVDKYQSFNPFGKTAWAQISPDILNSTAACLPGCSGITGTSGNNMLIDFLIYLFVFIGIDILAVKKNSKKYYLLLMPIFIVMIIIGIFIPAEILVKDAPRL